eukprot:1581592-Pyramimonas_sp.AAC.1
MTPQTVRVLSASSLLGPWRPRRGMPVGHESRLQGRPPPRAEPAQHSVGLTCAIAARPLSRIDVALSSKTFPSSASLASLPLGPRRVRPASLSPVNACFMASNAEGGL